MDPTFINTLDTEGVRPHMAGMVQHLVTLVQRMSFGPAMNSLTPRQRAWVVAFNNRGRRNAAQAMRDAGYKDHDNIRSDAYKMLHDPRIQAALKEDIQGRLHGGLAPAFARVEEIAKNPQHAQSLAANKFLISQGGMIEKTAVEHEITLSMTLEQQVDELIRIRGRENVDPRYLRLIDVTPDPAAEEPETW